MTAVSGEIGLRLKAVIDTAIDGIITIDNRGRIETINRSALHLFEYDESECIGNNISMLMPDPYKSEHDGYMSRYQKTKEPRIIGIGREVKGITKSGRIFPLRLAVSEVILNDRVIFTGIIHDLSEIKKTQEKLRQANKSLEAKVEERTVELEALINNLLQTNKKLERSELELTEALNKEMELNELKSRFVSMASHEFRTPLSTIMSSVALISKYEKGDQQDKRLKHVERIKSAVVNLTGILNDFLSLSKIEEGKVEIKKQNLDINTLCESVGEEVKGMLKPGQILHHIVNGEEKPINSDERILKNILFNLVSNAIKYSEKQIDCVLEYDENRFHIHVRDRGMGIPEQDQDLLFERFFRATNVENIQGTGLGLNIVKRYVSLLHGEISFSSKEGEGSTFSVSLPYN